MEQALSLCIMENNTECIPMSRTDPTDAVPEVDAICAARTLYGPVVNRENYTVTLSKRYHDRP